MRSPTQSSAATLLDLKDELGDLLLQVVFHAQMAQEAGLFDFGDVVEAITTKLIRRHPHVFGDQRDLCPRKRQAVVGRDQGFREGRAPRGAAGRRSSRGERIDRTFAGVTPALPCPHPCREAAGQGLDCRLRLE